MLDFSPYQKDIARLFQDGLDLERLRDKTILVVGATGLVGGCVVDVLMQNPARCYKVIAAGRNKERAQQKFAAYWEDESFFFAKIDVTQPVIKSMNGMMVESVYDELAEGADYIIDAASNASPNFFSREPVEVMLRSVPISLIPPAIYRAWNTLAKADRVNVPGVFTSPITFTVMVRVWPNDIFILLLLYLLPSVERSRAFA